jgi:Major royal jelly protein
LNYVKISDKKSSPTLYPYPSWADNELPATTENVLVKNNATIISTFRVRVDECDRLWVMDYALVDILGSPKQYAPNSIVIFDLKTDKLIRRFVIPEDQVKEDSFLAEIVSFPEISF